MAREVARAPRWETPERQAAQCRADRAAAVRAPQELLAREAASWRTRAWERAVALAEVRSTRGSNPSAPPKRIARSSRTAALAKVFRSARPRPRVAPHAR